ncbi:MAG: methylenetetrahydrofolate--tRNA-(uracil(54)-C(5))-methyltransferase (FADH(2)-oxidizing) TrmFO [Clostridia bacterium]|nr:methylenetetrahydrofolate--tRNA-(uracil(54)-C(5))-methyltransferase (FADH(2)-oxidizing) TrmFO [Clostridia bacterium]
MNKVTIIGAGLAGAEAALQLADLGVKVLLIDCKPNVMSPAHHSNNFAEVVCSNSFKSKEITSAGGLFKAELNAFGCKLLTIAQQNSVNAGGALAVDREKFSQAVTDLLRSHPNITIESYEAQDFDYDGITIVATGPLTMPKLAEKIKSVCGEFLYFFDAAAPIVSAESIDMDNAFCDDRYQKGEGDYINCPMNREEFEAFHFALTNAQTVEVKDFEKNHIFEGCMPIEVMASRGVDTIRFGPLKPVGLIDPKTQKRPYAVVQLRKETTTGDAYNLVGFQTHLTFGEQKRVFSMIPALKNAEFLKYGVMHKNLFINSSKLLNDDFSLKSNPNLYFAGQIVGVEGYVESIASGFVVAQNCFRKLNNLTKINLGVYTILGNLMKYVLTPNDNFQPMNANFGLLPNIETNLRDKKLKKQAYADRSLLEVESLTKNI